MKTFGIALRGGIAVVALVAGSAAAFAADVTYERLLNPEPENWLQNNRTYDGQRFSPLDEINRDNVADLKMAFQVPLVPSSVGAGAFFSSLQGTPLVDDGIMYMSDGWGRVYRIDASRGDRALINWIADPDTDPEFATGILNNRGVALYGDSVYSVTPDCGFIRINKETGEIIWRVETMQNPVEYCTMAPLALDGKIIIGPAGGDGPMSGRLEARSPETGEIIWTFSTILEETWGNGSAATGGAATWMTGSYDPDRNELVWGIGNPYPDFDPDVRPGDNLYSNSTVAVNADTGEINWHFQYTPNDSWDFDEVGTQTLYTVDVNGTQTKMVGHFARNGFFYNLDGATGAFLNGDQYAENVNWTAGIDPKTGMPLEYDANLDVQTYLPESRIGNVFEPGSELVYCPYIEGGVNMYPTSYSPLTNRLYALSIEGCTYNPAGRPEDAYLLGKLTAVDPSTGTVAGQIDFSSTGRGGALATAGGIVFGATTNGDFFAIDDTSLERLWNFNFGTSVDAPPITFAINGKQFVAVAIGPGGVNLGFHDYAAKGNDPDAPSMSNFQTTSTMYFFSL